MLTVYIDRIILSEVVYSDIGVLVSEHCKHMTGKSGVKFSDDTRQYKVMSIV